VDRFKKHEDEIRCIALSPDGSLIATASRDNTINLWDRATRRVLTVLKGHSGIVDGVNFSPDGKTLASVSQDYSIAFWDVAEALSGQPIVRSDDKKHFIKVGQRLFNVNVDVGARGLDVITELLQFVVSIAVIDRVQLASTGSCVAS
jgi:WD40 repeat protein